MKTIQVINITIIFRSISSFLLQDNVILVDLESFKEQLVFHDFSYVLKRRQDMFSRFYHTKH